MKQNLVVFLKHTIQTGHQHPNLNATVNNYTSLLMQMGFSQEQVRDRLNELGSEFGISFGLL